MKRRNSVLAAAILTSATALAAQPTKLQTIALPEQSRNQLSRIYQEKATRSPALMKLSTALVHGVRLERLDSQMLGVPNLIGGVRQRADGLVQVDITTEVTAELLRVIQNGGGEVETSFPQFRSVRAWVPFNGLEALAARQEVTRISEASVPANNQVNVSEGDVAHRTNSARPYYGVSGDGVKVGVLSDSVESLGPLQASGDLPAVSVLPGQGGSGTSEGTAMLEIVHDLAPNAQLLFATATGGEANFANNIHALANQGCKVIVDDVSYFTEPVFQDGLIAQAVDQVAAQGVVYLSSAGNSGNVSFGTESVWEGDFTSAGTLDFGDTAGTVASFGGSAFNTLESASSAVYLQWSDPWGASSNDYDLCVTSNSGVVLYCSVDSQDGAGSNPIEGVLCNGGAPCIPAGSRIYVVNYPGTEAPRFLHLYALNSTLSHGSGGHTWGHSAAVGALSVAAVDVATAGGFSFVGGNANPVETFSSDGPRRIFYNANGSAVTPGNFLASGGTVRQKPDFAAADGVATATPGFNPFFGTSAAAPHAAAIAALMLDARPGSTPTQVRQAFHNDSMDIMAPGVDRDSGYGLIDSYQAISSLTNGNSGCVPSSTTACVLAGRFKIEVQWTDFQGTTRNAFVASAGTSDTALFYWSNPNNWELLIKGINACTLNNKFWIYFAAATNVGYRVTVTDTQSDAAPKVYTNAVGNLAQATNDINAFNCP